jgi:hypothetical protein
MGLLDDAIRDHLELKRLRGADPGEVAREQKEALTPVLDDEGVAAEDDPPLVLEDFNLGTAQPAAAAEVAKGGQETAELDMQTVLGEEQDGSPHPLPDEAPGVSALPLDGPPAELDGQASLEWEVLDDPSTAPADPGTATSR